MSKISSDAPSPAQEHPAVEMNYLPAAWRRGIMHSVERIDRVIGRRENMPRLARDMRAMILAVHDELDRVAMFSRQASPATYDEAFQLCEDELAAQKTRLRGSSQKDTPQ